MPASQFTGAQRTNVCAPKPFGCFHPFTREDHIQKSYWQKPRGLKDCFRKAAIGTSVEIPVLLPALPFADSFLTRKQYKLRKTYSAFSTTFVYSSKPWAI